MGADYKGNCAGKHLRCVTHIPHALRVRARLSTARIRRGPAGIRLPSRANTDIVRGTPAAKMRALRHTLRPQFVSNSIDPFLIFRGFAIAP
ncbi:MAG TPA: hypothetical protein VFH71_05510 [Rhodanobacteraceae bacterium]|nr:hypothetical protein [Rhodanobacteraceae bacterium]